MESTEEKSLLPPKPESHKKNLLIRKIKVKPKPLSLISMKSKTFKKDSLESQNKIPKERSASSNLTQPFKIGKPKSIISMRAQKTLRSPNQRSLSTFERIPQIRKIKTQIGKRNSIPEEQRLKRIKRLVSKKIIPNRKKANSLVRSPNTSNQKKKKTKKKKRDPNQIKFCNMFNLGESLLYKHFMKNENWKKEKNPAKADFIPFNNEKRIDWGIATVCMVIFLSKRLIKFQE